MIALPLRRGDQETILSWREELQDGTLRTPYPLTLEQQLEWYDNIICDRKSTTRYVGFWDYTDHSIEGIFGKYTKNTLLGYGGIENISFENGNAEISLLINPAFRGKGYGKQAVDIILDTAFSRYRLLNVWGECYLCSKAVGFWKKIVKERDAFSTELPARKYFDGRLWPSYYFNFSK